MAYSSSELASNCDPHQVGSYLSNPSVLCCGGSWLAPKTALDAAEWGQITSLATEASVAVAAARSPKGIGPFRPS